MLKTFFSGIFLFFLIGQPVIAGDLSAWARTIQYSCGYYTNTQGDLHVTYKNLNLPYGSKVSFIYGLEGKFFEGDKEVRESWSHRQVGDGIAIDEWTWKAEISAYMHQRGDRIRYDAFNLVVEVQLPEGSHFYENGSNSPWGYYRLPMPYNGRCSDDDLVLPEFHELAVEVVLKSDLN